MTKVSQDLATFVANITISDIDEDVQEKAGKLLLDIIGCSVAAFTSPPVKALWKTYAGSTGEELATVVGTGRRASVADAALINATMARYHDYNDCYMGVTAACHPSDHIMALLSVAEAEGASGAEFVEAMVTAYEIEARGIDECPVRTNGFDYVLGESIRAWPLPENSCSSLRRIWSTRSASPVRRTTRCTSPDVGKY